MIKSQSTAGDPKIAESGPLVTWRSHIGRREVRREVLDVESLRRFAVASYADPAVELCFPPLGHWAFFLETPPAESLGADGHPVRGDGLLPAVTLPRRMFAAATVDFAGNLWLGVEAELTSTVLDVRQRTGASGDLVFVDLERTIAQADRMCVREVRSLVYRGGEPTGGVTAKLAGLSLETAETWRPQELDLFRFSAATFNGHRIHYDRDYARQEEGYPDLVVHGPFTATMLCALAMRQHPGRRLRRFRFRATAPLFVGELIRLTAVADSAELHAIRPDGGIAMSATAEFEDA